mmetsp:Transcript_43425/g.101408  ORF Transcript_43425/g.101408 Transcript_43425/m.101408 type:complete len:640 (+) Transcript_43425:96-2015(+)
MPVGSMMSARRILSMLVAASTLSRAQFMGGFPTLAPQGNNPFSSSGKSEEGSIASLPDWLKGALEVQETTAAPTPAPPAPAAPAPAPFFPAAPAAPAAPAPAPAPIAAPAAPTPTGVDVPSLIGAEKTDTGPGLSLHQMDSFAFCKTKSDAVVVVAGTTSRRLLNWQDLQEASPMKIFQRLLVCVLTIVVLVLLWTNRKAVLLIITGDDKLHATIPDCCWYGVWQCCGFCKWDCLHAFTDWACCGSWRGSNPVRKLGQLAGVTSMSVEMSNIVVGDIPFYRYGSFSVSVECGKYPALTTSMQEDQDPKTMHFPEVLTMRLRDTMWDLPVVITVNQINFVGIHEIAQVRVNPKTIAKWAQEDQDNCTKRLGLKLFDADLEAETPPWISITFGTPVADVRHLDNFHANSTQSVRLATWDNMPDPQTGEFYRERRLVDVKHDYRLVDGGGVAQKEPEEADLACLRALRNLLFYIYSGLSFLTVVGVLGYGAFRYYVKNCYEKFELLTVAKSWQPHDFPMPSCALHSIAHTCEVRMQGTGIEAGADVCRPLEATVEQTCVDPPQARPTAFSFVLEDLGLGTNSGIQCFHGICEFRNKIVKFDKVVFWGSLGMIVFTFCLCRPLGNMVMQQARREAIKRHNEGV